ncbi:MAG: hypothetical protein KGM99_17730, partial [Burkholderiales bacterium]|nr:hypothetical protein [Burkholderiales bacterium]
MKRLSLRAALCVLPLIAALSAHAADGSLNLGSMFMNSLKKATGKNGDAPQDASAAQSGSYQKLTDTKLKDLFKAYPVRDDVNPPAFPKVAIRITSFSKSLDQWENRRNTPDECVTYNVTLWTDERTHESFDNLRMCATDLAFNISFVSVRSPWPVKFNYNKNSGQARDDGPVAPSAPYPADPVAKGFLQGGGVFYIGSMFVQLGYDWNYPHDTMRVWVSGVSKVNDGSAKTSFSSAGSAGGVAMAATTQSSGLPAEYSNYPAAGNYDASDARFDRILSVRADGKFSLEVTPKGGAANAHSGSGQGQLIDAPGGWRYAEGNCNVSFRRGASALQVRAESCASAWGDVPFDGR